MCEKYDHLTIGSLKDCVHWVRKGFLSEPQVPSLDDVKGRKALDCIFNLLTDVIEDYDTFMYMRSFPLNVGGSDPNHDGNCTIAEFVRPIHDSSTSVDEIVDSLTKWTIEEAAQPETAGKRRRKRRFHQRSTIHVQVPDVQFVRLGLDSDDHFLITAAVKSQPIDDDCIRQAWNQALVGLLDHDVSYAVLLSPEKGLIYKLCIAEPQPGAKHRCLMTDMKEYGFLPSTYKFNVEDFITFMEAILSIMISS